MCIRDRFSITDGVSVKLDKRIPVAAGRAGGSTDAAAMLIGVNRLFSLGLTKKQLIDVYKRQGYSRTCYLRYYAVHQV